MTTIAVTSVNRPMPNPADAEMIAAYLESLRRLNRSQQTIALRRTVVTNLSRDLTYGIGETTTEELAAWLYRDTWGQNTRAAYLASIRDFYSWATAPRDQWLSYDPALDLDDVSTVKGVARPCTDQELQRILTEAGEPYRTWSYLAAYQGLRCIEISGLDREHVTPRILHVARGKGGRPRVHDTDPQVWQLIEPLPLGPIARLVRTGNRASAKYISFRTAEHYRVKLGLNGVTLHRLRHWLGVTTQRLYRDIRVTQEVLGHKSLSSTQIYTMASMDQQREARAMLPRLGGAGPAGTSA